MMREESGLGSPPMQYKTNASEKAHFMLKSKVNYKNELPEFLQMYRQLNVTKCSMVHLTNSSLLSILINLLN